MERFVAALLVVGLLQLALQVVDLLMFLLLELVSLELSANNSDGIVSKKQNIVIARFFIVKLIRISLGLLPFMSGCFAAATNGQYDIEIAKVQKKPYQSKEKPKKVFFLQNYCK